MDGCRISQNRNVQLRTALLSVRQERNNRPNVYFEISKFILIDILHLMRVNISIFLVLLKSPTPYLLGIQIYKPVKAILIHATEVSKHIRIQLS